MIASTIAHYEQHCLSLDRNIKQEINQNSFVFLENLSKIPTSKEVRALLAHYIDLYLKFA